MGRHEAGSLVDVTHEKQSGPAVALELTGVTRGYAGTSGRPRNHGSQEPRLVLTGVDLRLEAGGLVAVVGPSGSGKSTLLRIAAGLDDPDDGRVVLAGRELGGLSEGERRGLRRTHLAFIFQSGNLLDALTARENVELALEGFALGEQERRVRVDEAIEEFGLAHLSDRFPHQLSAGEQQRVAVARALARRPPVVICDEPTAHLDADNADLLARALLGLTRAGTACLLATHDLLVAGYAHRVLRLAGGRLVAREQRPELQGRHHAVGVVDEGG